MKDFMNKYHKNKVIGNIGIIALSLVMAIGINIYVIDGTSMGDNLKTSVLNASQEIEQKAELYLESDNNKIIAKNSKTLNNAENISLSFSFNPENIEIASINSKINTPTILSNTNGISSIIVDLKGQNIEKNTEIVEIFTKKINNSSENINLLNVNFKDSENEIYKLTTSGITF